ncbi:NUDIX hydrolase [Rhizobium sp. BK251]|uniref:NUDIX hydrolase n=1 Tax=Rhizobium sp. BK251 TaxID=2512125 RepID=UPI00105233F0|nr:NUDIX hydrolase [Rhizobium sp. BK251]TCL62369.1 8-oxo-dGTP pyrophosphatase MutT (NUDIX family) [Rhizobium sp. BK251]
MAPDALKVLIYGVCRGQLLVFDEPDFPDVALQVPGGTVEAGESAAQAAHREFAEETGLPVTAPPELLGIHDYRFAKGGGQVWHRRHYFRIELSGTYPECWLHHEMTPSDGSSPIRFRLFWMDVNEASRRLGYGMADLLHLLQGAPVAGGR